MKRTAVQLAGIELPSSLMNASGARSAERGEIYELAAVHNGLLLFKSCNIAGLDAPENLKNRGADYFAGLARELVERGKLVAGSVVGANEDEFVEVARRLDKAGARLIELNLADDYVLKSAAPFSSFERLKSLIGRVRGEVGAQLAVKMPALPRDKTRAYADLLKSLRVAAAVCHNDLPKDVEIDISAGVARGSKRALSQAHDFFLESDEVLEVVAVGGINSGRDAYIAHLAGARAMQVGSALMKEGAGALGRIDRELAALLEENRIASVNAIVGRLTFA